MEWKKNEIWCSKKEKILKKNKKNTFFSFLKCSKKEIVTFVIKKSFFEKLF